MCCDYVEIYYHEISSVHSSLKKMIAISCEFDVPTLSLINPADDIDGEGMPIDRTPMEPMAATPEDIVAILDAHNLCRSEAARGINPASNLTASGMPRLVQLIL